MSTSPNELPDPFDDDDDVDSMDLLEHRRTKRAILIPQYSSLIQSLAMQHAHQLNLPDSTAEGDAFPDERLSGMLWDAALEADERDDKAIRDAIQQRLQDCLNTYGKEE